MIHQEDEPSPSSSRVGGGGQQILFNRIKYIEFKKKDSLLFHLQTKTWFVGSKQCSIRTCVVMAAKMYVDWNWKQRYNITIFHLFVRDAAKKRYFLNDRDIKAFPPPPPPGLMAVGT